MADKPKINTIYSNIQLMLARREIKLSAPADAESLSKHFAVNQRAVFKGSRSQSKVLPDADVVVILFAPGESPSGVDFKNIVERVIGNLGETLLLDLCVIVETPSRNMAKQLRTCTARKAKRPPRNVYEELLSYEPFYIDTTTHTMVPKHELIVPGEFIAFCAEYFTDPMNFPRIYNTDVAAINIGARPGQFIRIYRDSEATGVAIMYRVCVRNPDAF